MRQGSMFRLTILVAAMLSMQVLVQSHAAWAEPSSPDTRDEVRGMFVLKLPFGGGNTFSAPRVGFEFNMQRRSDLDYLKESRDPQTGRRLPEVDSDGIHTWSIEDLEFTLPQDQPENEERPGRLMVSG